MRDRDQKGLERERLHQTVAWIGSSEDRGRRRETKSLSEERRKSPRVAKRTRAVVWTSRPRSTGREGSVGELFGSPKKHHVLDWL